MKVLVSVWIRYYSKSSLMGRGGGIRDGTNEVV